MWIRASLDQRQFALDRLVVAEFLRAHGEIHHPVNGNDALQLRLDLLEHMRRCRGHDGDARKMRLVLGFRYCEAVVASKFWPMPFVAVTRFFGATAAKSVLNNVH